jgi:site-specific DNA-adenine methylase
MATVKLSELAKTIRSKNAGVDRLTFDVIFLEKNAYERVRKTGALTRESVARLYGIDESRITDFVYFDPAYAIKFSISRNRPSGSPGDSDIFGSQQYAPLLDVEIPME